MPRFRNPFSKQPQPAPEESSGVWEQDPASAARAAAGERSSAWTDDNGAPSQLGVVAADPDNGDAVVAGHPVGLPLQQEMQNENRQFSSSSLLDGEADRPDGFQVSGAGADLEAADVDADAFFLPEVGDEVHLD